jgi:hypothetical protein
MRTSAPLRASMPDHHPAALRKRAATARRLARDLSSADAERLKKIATDLEAEAREQERAEADESHRESGA